MTLHSPHPAVTLRLGEVRWFELSLPCICVDKLSLRDCSIHSSLVSFPFCIYAASSVENRTRHRLKIVHENLLPVIGVTFYSTFFLSTIFLSALRHSGSCMVWMKNRVIACYTYASDAGDRVEFDLEMDPTFVFHLDNGETLHRRSQGLVTPFGFRAEICGAKLNEDHSSGFLRLDLASTNSVLPGAPILLIVYRMRSDLFSDLQNRIEAGDHPRDLMVRVYAFLNFVKIAGKETALSVLRLGSLNEFIWKRAGEIYDHSIQDIVLSYQT